MFYIDGPMNNHWNNKRFCFFKLIQQVRTLLQLTSSEKGTKMTSELHISKPESLSFSDKIHENSNFLPLIWRDTLFWTEKLWNILILWILLKKIKISNSETWSLDVISLLFLKKVICTLAQKRNKQACFIQNAKKLQALRYLFLYKNMHGYLCVFVYIFVIKRSKNHY